MTVTLNKQIIAARRHLDSLVWYYLLQIKQRMATNTHVLVEEEVPSLISINLIDKKEGQGMLGMLWAKVFNDIGSPVNKENDKLEKEEILYDLTEIAANAKKGVDKKVEETEDSTDNDNDDQSMRKLVDKFATDLKTIDRKIITSQDFISSISTSNETVSLCHKLVWFDYHSLCHAADQSALLGLFMHLQCHFNSSDYLFLRKEEDAKINYQRSILRTNCMDCLDRTNVVQVCVYLFKYYVKIKILTI